MRQTKLLPLLLALVLLCLSTPAHAQQLWSGLIDPSRAVDWSRAGVQGGIPNRTTICRTLSPVSGDNSSQINSALAACSAPSGPGSVVFLSPGTYAINRGVDFSSAGVRNVTLRGAGPDQTFLVFSGGFAGCGGLGADVCVRGSAGFFQGQAAGTTNWTGGYAQGTTQITLSSVSGLAVGMIIILDQLDDASIPASGPFVIQTPTYQQGGTESVGRNGNRAQNQLVKITGISGNTVTIDPPLHMTNWSASKSPGAWWWGNTAQGDPTTAQWNGVEAMSLDHSGSSATAGILLYQGHNLWVKNIRSLNSNRDHIWLNACLWCEVRDSYFFGTQSQQSTSYGVELFPATEALIVNNIFQQVTTPHLEGQSSGCVTAYSFAIFMKQTLNPLFMFFGDLAAHHAAAAMNLHEGIQSNGTVLDLDHGTANLMTYFRNQYIGTDTGATDNTATMVIKSWERYVNIIGNVLGTPGYHRNYEYSDAAQGNKSVPYSRSIFVLGFTDCCDGYMAGLPFDPVTYNSLYRWGNFDYATNTARWNPNEVPTGQAQPSTQKLPPSLFLSSKPSWFGSVPWPAIGPDVAGNVNNNPAKRCYLTVMNGPANGTGGPLTFNANNCYAASTARPSAPQGLVVQ